MFHHAYVGHFEPDENGIRFARQAPEAAPQPVLKRPLEDGAIQAILQDYGLDRLPENWGITKASGYLVCDVHTRSRDAIEFISKLARVTCCAIFDYSSLAIVRPEEYRYRWDQVDHRTTQAAAG